MLQKVSYKKEDAPTIGFIMATLEAEFDKDLKEKVRSRYRSMFESFRKEGIVSEKSLFFGNCEGEEEIRAACGQLTDSRADGIIFHPLTWPAGEAITALATYRYLLDIPLFVSASPEVFPEKASPPYAWPQNSDCGKLFANSIFYKLDRKTLWATGLPEEDAYRSELFEFFTVCRIKRDAQRARIVVIGNILDDFPESFYNPLTVRREVGVRVMEIDSSVVFSLYEDGEYPKRGLKLDTAGIEEEAGRVSENIAVKVKDDTLQKATRFYFAYKVLLESLGAEGAVFRCAPEIQEKYSLALCGVLSQLISNGVIGTGGCEGDVLNTVTGLLQYYASGRPTTCLDWIDKPGAEGRGMYTLLHCGNACKSMIIPETGTIDYHQAWTYEPLGYTIEGALNKGPVTVARLRENRQGELELLIVEGESVADTMKIRGNYGLLDIGDERLKKLAYLLNENGWPHHLSLGWGHHGDILAKAAKFLGAIKVMRV